MTTKHYKQSMTITLDNRCSWDHVSGPSLFSQDSLHLKWLILYQLFQGKVCWMNAIDDVNTNHFDWDTHLNTVTSYSSMNPSSSSWGGGGKWNALHTQVIERAEPIDPLAPSHQRTNNRMKTHWKNRSKNRRKKKIKEKKAGRIVMSSQGWELVLIWWREDNWDPFDGSIGWEK